MGMKPILSIIVATRNRSKYCIELINTILSFEFKHFELVIHDNSDEDTLGKYISDNLNDLRIVYKHDNSDLSTVHNANKAIELSNGDYLCMIGDDDGINPEIFLLVEWMSQNNIQSAKTSLAIMYRWPDACEILHDYKGHFGNLEIYDFNGAIESCSVKKELNILLETGCQNYLERNLPKLYHGIVSRNKLVEIKSSIGKYTGGLSPDIYWVICLSKLIDKIIFIDYPLTIPGTSIAALDRSHVKEIFELHDAPHFRARGKYEWSNVIPRFYCAENIWADSAYAALVDNKMTSEQSKFNLLYLSSVLFGKYPDKRELIVNNLDLNSNQWIYRKIPVTLLHVNSKILKYKVKLNNVIRKIKKRYYKPIFYKSEFKNVASIKEATQLVLNTFKEKNISLEDILKRYQRNHFI
jgi:glycosyltransferase involved in cell wall biosynthesis